VLLFLYGDPEPLQTLAGLLGLFGYGLALAALGCFTSSLTRSQIIAAVVAIILGLIWYLLQYAGQLAPEGLGRDLFGYIPLGVHFEPALSGEVRSEDLVYFGVVSLFLLSLVRLVLESLRWR
jgi:ABC-2 type transport system permease protein